MSGILLKRMFCTFISSLLCLMAYLTHAAETQETEIIVAPDIPGITVNDPFPMGCVSCHIDMPDRNKDARISSLMQQLTDHVPPALLAKAQLAAPDGIILKGKHPATDTENGDIPASCLACHDSSSQDAPFFSRMLHLIHLTGGNGNHYMTIFQGQCTYCHKLDVSSGGWTIPSGKEK